MSKHRDYVLVLWGSNFEEVAATIFVTQLREAGLRVKVVGLLPYRTGGSHGLALVPDFTLGQALPLAADTICLIVPYPLCGLKRLENDPRLGQFLDRAQANNAKIVIGPGRNKDALGADLRLFSTPADDVIIYPADQDLFEFARNLAESLRSRGGNGESNQ